MSLHYLNHLNLSGLKKQTTDTGHDPGRGLTHLAELAHDVFEDFARGIVEEGLQTWQVGALLQNALQSLLTLKRKRRKRN